MNLMKKKEGKTMNQIHERKKTYVSDCCLIKLGSVRKRGVTVKFSILHLNGMNTNDFDQDFIFL